MTKELKVIRFILFIMLLINFFMIGFVISECIYRHYPHTEVSAFYEVEMEVTAYCPCEKCCGIFADWVTASGFPAEGFLLAAPSKYPFGTLMAVEGYARGKYVPVLDRGGAIKGNKLDCYFPTHQEALDWGRQIVKVKVMKERLEQ